VWDCAPRTLQKHWSMFLAHAENWRKVRAKMLEKTLDAVYQKWYH
jgi:hypothetical protein